MSLLQTCQLNIRANDQKGLTRRSIKNKSTKDTLIFFLCVLYGAFDFARWMKKMHYKTKFYVCIKETFEFMLSTAATSLSHI